MKKRIKRIVLAVIFLAILSAVVVALLNPLRKSEEQIRADLLKLTPIGTDMQELKNPIKRTGKIDWVREDWGIVIGPRGPSGGYPLDDEELIGEKSMRVYLGDYYVFFPFGIYVEAFYAFDENGKLIEIAIRKGTNV